MTTSMRRGSRTLAAILSFAFLVTAGTTPAFAKDKDKGIENITKTVYFLAKDADSVHEPAFDKTIIENGITYTLDKKKVKKVKTLSKKEHYEGLSEKAAPERIDMKYQGEVYSLFFDEDASEFKTEIKEKSVTETGKNPWTYKAPSTITAKNDTGATVTGRLKGTTKSANYKVNVTMPGTFVAPANASYFRLSSDGTLWPLDESRPLWKGYETDILNYLELNPKEYAITGGTWTGKTTKNGTVYRTASFTGTKVVCDYTNTYDISGGVTTYSCDAIYNGDLMKMELTYNAPDTGLSFWQKVALIGAGVILLAGAIAALLYFLAKRRGEEEDEEELARQEQEYLDLRKNSKK